MIQTVAHTLTTICNLQSDLPYGQLKVPDDTSRADRQCELVRCVIWCYMRYGLAA